jgi:AbiU2
MTGLLGSLGERGQGRTQRPVFEHVTTADRVQAAKVKTERVVDHLLYLLALHESNAIIVYSDTLSSQIRRSLAANAFNVFQGGLHQFEIVRLCALWDRAGPDRESIPTIIELIDLPDSIESLAQETLAHWSGIGGDIMDSSDEMTKEALQRSNEAFGQAEAQKARDGLRKAIDDVRTILNSATLKGTSKNSSRQVAANLTR